MKLRFVVCLLALICFGAAVGRAQSVPTLEVGINYSHVGVTPTSSQIGNFTMNGASGQVVYNFNKWVSAVGDVGYYTHSTLNSVGLIGLQLHPTEISYTLGPRLSYRRLGRFVPYGEILIGMFHDTGGGNITTLDDPVKSQFKLGYSAGGGVDVGITPHIAVKAIELNVARTQFAEQGTFRQVQTNLRVSAGVVLRF